MSFHFLRDDALEYGADLRTWPRDRQLAAVCQFYRLDNATACPGWMADALSETAAIAGWRELALQALEHTNPIDGSAMAYAVLREALVPFPLDWLSRQIEPRIDIWREEARIEKWAAERERRDDARRELEPWEVK